MRYYFVDYNGAFVARYKSVRACVNFINRNDLRDDLDNVLRIVDSDGDVYNGMTGNPIC